MKRRRLTVAVVIPTIEGREKYLHRAVASVHAQDRWDPSQGDQLIVERDPGRTGAAATRNRALERVTADVVAWLDDDDWLKPHHVKVCGRVLHEHLETTLVYPRPVMAPRTAHDPTATRYQGVFPVSPWGIRWCPELEDHLRNVGSFIPMTHLVRTAAVRDAGGFPEGRTLDSGRYQGEDERYLISLLDHGAVFEHIARPTWFWETGSRSTAGQPLQRPTELPVPDMAVRT